LSSKTGICICGKKTKIKANGKMGETCGRKRCSGLKSKEHMKEVLKTQRVSPHCFTPRTIHETWK
jgi:hypothetical protein